MSIVMLANIKDKSLYVSFFFNSKLKKVKYFKKMKKIKKIKRKFKNYLE